MKWLKWGKYAIKTDCDKYSISKAFVNGKPIYTLWKLPDTFIKNFEDVKDAKSKALEIVANESALFDSGINRA